MAEPVSLATGVLGLATFALEASKALYNILESYRNQGRTVRELKEELEAIIGVLQSLQDTIEHPDIDLGELKIPLLRCGQACEDFARIVRECTSRSGVDRSSFRDWIMLTYREKDISGFRNLIAAYKSTVAVALANANIRHVTVTAKLLQEYKVMIDQTTLDLQELLQASRLKTPQPHSAANTTINGSSISQADIKEERACLEQCLSVCNQVSRQLDEIQANNFGDIHSRDNGMITVLMDNPSQARFITTTRLKDCKAGITLTSSELQARLKEADSRLASGSRVSPQDPAAHGLPESREGPVSEEDDSIRQCLSICEDATKEATKERINVFEDVSMADDGDQFIVATLGDLISARRIIVGSRSIQVLGQMSDASLQQISKDRAQTRVSRETQGETRGEAISLTSQPERAAQQDQGPNSPHFIARHGAGQKLS